MGGEGRTTPRFSRLAAKQAHRRRLDVRIDELSVLLILSSDRMTTLGELLEQALIGAIDRGHLELTS